MNTRQGDVRCGDPRNVAVYYLESATQKLNIRSRAIETVETNRVSSHQQVLNLVEI